MALVKESNSNDSQVEEGAKSDEGPTCFGRELPLVQVDDDDRDEFITQECEEAGVDRLDIACKNSS